MPQIDEALSLMERMNANDKKAQENRAERMEEYKNSKPSRDYFKRRANEQLHKYIMQYNCNYEQFKLHIEDGRPESHFEEEYWQEIQNTTMNLLSDKGYFDKYCLDHGLSVQSK